MLDWELSTLGDPLADFTYHLMAWHMPLTESAAGTATLAGHDLAALGIPSMADYVEAYVARTGLDPRPALPVYLAYNFFRIAAILQGIIGRVRDGTATSEFAPAKAEMIRPLADKAWEFARQSLIYVNNLSPARGRVGTSAIEKSIIHERHQYWHPGHHAEPDIPQPARPTIGDAPREPPRPAAAARHGQAD